MLAEDKLELKDLTEKITELNEQLEDDIILHTYYSGAAELEQDTRKEIKRSESKVKIIKLLDEDKIQ